MDLLRIASSSPMNLLRIAALLGAAAAASPWNFGQGSSNAATRAALESFQSDGFGMFIHNGPVTQWGTDIGWPLVCTTLPCTVPGPKNVPRNLTTTDELAAHRREYFDLAKTWDPKDFNATALARRAKDAGMKYVVYTTLAKNYRPDIFWFDCHNAPPWDTRLDAVAPAIRAANPLVLTRNGVFSDYLELPDQSEAAVLQGVLDYQSFSGAPFEKPANLVIANLMLIRAKGGNYLLDVSPTPEGPLAASADGVLAELAAWMAVNGEALHGAAPAYPYSDGASAFYTSKAAGDGLALYVMVELLGFGEVPAVAADAGLVLPIPAEIANLAFAKNGLVFKLHYAAA
ncbi:alpha-L-fucosidase [Aureococcus anophagefferens]|nr:alpha-L-fucosidase [Aureococcus anophagefferens]